MRRVQPTLRRSRRPRWGGIAYTRYTQRSNGCAILRSCALTCWDIAQGVFLSLYLQVLLLSALFLFLSLPLGKRGPTLSVSPSVSSRRDLGRPSEDEDRGCLTGGSHDFAYRSASQARKATSTGSRVIACRKFRNQGWDNQSPASK